MQPFENREIWEQKEILNGLFFDGLSYEQISKKYGILPVELKMLVDSKAVKPYDVKYSISEDVEDSLHKTTFFKWINFLLITAGICYVLVVVVQVVFNGVSQENIFTAIRFITSILAKILSLSFAMAFILLVFYYLFPILAKFLNYKVNTVYLHKEFLAASSEHKLKFLSSIFLALCILVGLVFSAKAQTNDKRACVVATAKKEIGTVEHGGNNRGKQIDYYRSVALNKTVKGYSDPWCGYFVAFVYRICGIVTKVNFSPRARDWFSNPKKIVWKRHMQYGLFDKPPQAGDVIGYLFRAGTISHIEILAEWFEDEDYYYAVGGNTSSSNTVYRDANNLDGVKYKKRQKEMAYIIANHID